MPNQITAEKLQKYFDITIKALDKAKKAINEKEHDKAHIFLDMASRYCEDAQFFRKNNDLVTAFGAISYAHGWLDAGARIGIFKVKDSDLFVVG